MGNKICVSQTSVEDDIPVLLKVKTGESTYEWMTNFRLRNLRALGLMI